MSDSPDNRKAAPTSGERAGQADAPKGTERSHTLLVLANNEPGMVDRVVGVLRRRRAQPSGHLHWSERNSERLTHHHPGE